VSVNQGADNTVQRLEMLENHRKAFMLQYTADHQALLDEIRAIRQSAINQTKPPMVNPISFTGNNPPQSDIKKAWPWVDLALAQSIAIGEFEITDLLKLHFNEDIRLSRTDATQVARGTNLQIPPSQDTQPTVMIPGTTKLSRIITDFATFIPAWTVYCSIRGYYNPEYTLPLQSWTVHLAQILALGAQWKFVLDYIIAVYDNNKFTTPKAWLDINPLLIAQYIIVPTNLLAFNIVNVLSSSRTPSPPPTVPPPRPTSA
jgi:hypothetical protein